VSLPMTVLDRRKAQVFPGSTSNAFAFQSPGGYFTRDTLRYREGYWLKFPSAMAVNFVGAYRTLDTIDVVQGWNLIGSLSFDVSVGSIEQIPSGIVISPYWDFAGGTYVSASTLVPMKGYWVKVNQNGKLVLSSGPGPALPLPSNTTTRIQ
jgi:hypothetical protein